MGRAALNRYLNRLLGTGTGSARFHARADNLNFYLATVEKRLWNLSQRLSASARLPGLYSSQGAGLGDETVRPGGTAIGNTEVSWREADKSVHLLSFGPALYRDFYNSVRPIKTMDDMKGLKIRVPKNEVMIATFEAFGAEPVPLAWSETPAALQTGTVDGGDSGTLFIRDMLFFEFEPHLVILEHFVAMSPLFASDRFMKSLSDEQREQVLRAAPDAGVEMRNQVQAETEEIREWLATEGGMEMTRPDKAAFIEAAATVQQGFAKERGQDFVELVEQIRMAAE